jgi:type IV secretory pathway TraG/TraD family ATPase VirD4
MGNVVFLYLFGDPMNPAFVRTLKKPVVQFCAIFVVVGIWGQIALNISRATDDVLGIALTIPLTFYMLWFAYRSHEFALSQAKDGYKRFWIIFTLQLMGALLLYKTLPITMAAIVIGLLAMVIHANLIVPQIGRMAIEGEALLTAAEAQQAYGKLPAGDRGIHFGGVKLPTSEAGKHILFTGTTSSGKTTQLCLYMQDTLLGVGLPDSKKRAFIYDPKQDMLPFLVGLHIPEDALWVMNPYDQRCRPWNMAKDIKSPTDANTLAEILVPENTGKTEDDFWRSATIVFIKAVVRTLNYRAYEVWTFRDLLFAVRDARIVRKMIEKEPRLQHYAQVYGSDNTANNIIATVITKVERYEPIAGLWHKAETVYGNVPVSLKEWLQSSSVMVIGRDATAERELREVNRVLFTRVVQLVQNQPESQVPHTFFILDELGSLGNLASLLPLATEGRSKGAAIAAGFQSEAHIAENFNENIATTILGQFNHIAALRVRDTRTEEWIRKLTGSIRGIQMTENYSDNWSSGRTHGASYSYYEEQVIRPGALTSIPPFRPEQGVGLTGIYLGHKNWQHTYPAEIVKSLAKKNPLTPHFIPMLEEYQEIDPWTKADLQRLNLMEFADLIMDNNSGTEWDADAPTAAGSPADSLMAKLDAVVRGAKNRENNRRDDI